MQQPAQPTQEQQIVHLNWSHFKPEFSEKPEEDAEAHLLTTNDWMNTHHFWEAIKVQRFCLTLVGEATLWYESLEPINIGNVYRLSMFGLSMFWFIWSHYL